MTSSLIPDVDDVPSLASRVVSIDATTMLEVRPDDDRDLWVDFSLTCDLHVRADDKIVMAGTERVHLDRGQGSIRLPAYTDAATTADGSDEWGIVVRKSWSTGCRHGRSCGCNAPYVIRVPEGTTSMSLADLPAVKELTMRERIWRITGASASVSEGAQWDVSAEVRGNLIDFDWTVPPGGEAWSKGALNATYDRYALPEGIYRVQSNAVAEALELPDRRTGKLEVLEVSPGSGIMIHRWTTNDVDEGNPLESWVQASNHLGQWTRPWVKIPTSDDVDQLRMWWGTQSIAEGIDDLPHRGMSHVSTGGAARELSLPGGLTGYLENLTTANNDADLQTYLVRSGRPRLYGRALFSGGWRDWVQVGFSTGNVLTADTPVENIFEDGVYAPASDGVAEALGLPGGVRGSLYAANLSATYTDNSNMTLMWLPSSGGAWTRSKVNGSWRDWQGMSGGGTSTGGGAGHVILWGSSTPEALTPVLADTLAPYRVAVHGRASGGEWSSQTVTRIGSTPITMTPAGGALPATGTVEVDSAIFDGHPQNLLQPCTGWLGGVHGTLVGYGREDGYYEFTRTMPGDPIEVTDAAWIPEVKTPGHLHIWSAGKNDLNVGRTAAHLARVIERRDQAVAHWASLNSDFLILGHFVNRDTPASDSRRTQIEADNADAAAKYPDHYLSMQALVTGDEVWEWTGLTPTTEDEEQMALGNLPPSLQGIGNHLNEAGERYLAHKITEWMVSRDMIGQGRAPFTAHTHVVSDTGTRFRLATDGTALTLVPA